MSWPTLVSEPFMLGRTSGWVKRGLAAFTLRTLCSTLSHSSSRLGESAFRQHTLFPVTIYTPQHNRILSCFHIIAWNVVFCLIRHLTMCKTLRADHLEDLFSISTSNAAGAVDLNLTLRFPDHIALWTDMEQFLSQNLLPQSIKSDCYFQQCSRHGYRMKCCLKPTGDLKQSSSPSLRTNQRLFQVFFQVFTIFSRQPDFSMGSCKTQQGTV